MNALPTIPDKIGILIPRLASDADGEVVATARAIGRQLHGAGLDWHDLAARLIAEPAEPAFSPVDAPIETYAEAVAWILANDAGRLSMKEAIFVRNMRVNLARWGKPTPKQAKWIEDIFERLGGRWAWT